MQKHAAYLLSLIADGDASCEAALVQHGAVPALIALLQPGTATAVQQQAARALANVAAGDASCKAALVQHSAVPALIALFKSSVSDEASYWAAQALHTLNDSANTSALEHHHV